MQDVAAVLDQLEAWNSDPANALAGKLDKEVGMSGHSFGAITTQGVSGQALPVGEQQFTDPRRPAIAFSPSTPRLVAAARTRRFSAAKIPWLLMTGTKDLAPIGQADMKSRLGVYSALRGAPKYEVVLHDAEHSAFADRALPGGSGSRAI